MAKKKRSNRKNVRVFSKKKKRNERSDVWLLTSIILAVLLAVSIFTHGFNLGGNDVNSILEQVSSLKESTANEDLKQTLTGVEESLEPYKEVKEVVPVEGDVVPVKVEFYIMSQCPYGTQVEDAIYPVLEQLGANVDFNIDFISTDLGGGKFQSLHGEPETQGNIVQLCAAKYDPDKYMDMIVCQNKNARAIPGNWESCAKDNGLDVESIKTCFEGDEGKQLLSESVLKANAANARGSPTIYIDGELYQGGRTERDFLVAICNAYEGEVPSACSDIPKPQEIALTIVNDERCTTCDTAQIMGALKQLFPGLKATTVDISSSEGSSLIEEFGLTHAPSFIFDAKIAEEEGFKSNAQLQSAFTKVGDNYRLVDEAVGAEWLIDDAARESYLEGLKIPQTDKPVVELFIMSHCPYGTQSEKGILPAVRELGDSIDFKIRFVYYAMHGQKEIDEQLNQYCIQKEQEDVYLDYLACFLKDENGAAACMEENGVDVDMMNTCVAAADTEFKITESFEDKASWLSGRYPLFNTDATLNTKYSVGGSPTLIINGKQSEAGRNPASYLAGICEAFTEKPAACDAQLETANPGPGFGYDSTAAATAAGCGV